MKIRELRALSIEELQARLGESQKALLKLCVQQATGAMGKSSDIRMVRRTIAQILTLQKEKGITLPK